MADYQKISDTLDKIVYGFNALSIIGSILSIIVYSRKAFEKSSFGFYCKWVSIFDLVNIVNLGFGIASLIVNSSFINYYDSICKIYYYILAVTSSLPIWILVIFSFDQVIIVSRTERFQFFKKRWFQYTCISTIIVFQSAIYTSLIVLSGVQNAQIQNTTFSFCTVYSNVVPIVFLVESKLIPFLLIIISMYFLVSILIKSRKKGFLE